MTMHWCENHAELLDFISYVVGYAPDQFPFRDYLGDDGQLNLARAFGELRHGLDCTAKEIGSSFPVEKFLAMLEEAYQHYLAGRRKDGAWKLQEIQEMLEKI